MPPVAKTNALGLSREEYKGVKSTLCPGCGHDSISNQIISAMYDLGINQHNLIKLSGIGCSSKTPAYFLAARPRPISWGGRTRSTLYMGVCRRLLPVRRWRTAICSPSA